MKSVKLHHLNWVGRILTLPSPLTLLGSPAITAKSSITRLSAFHELQLRGNPLVPVFRGLHRGEPDGLVLQGLVREEPGKHSQAFPCHQGLVPRLPLPHALARMGLAPGRNASLVKAVDLQSAVGGGKGCPNSTLTARMTVFLFNGARPASIMVTFG
jgi:hypothetical protein